MKTFGIILAGGTSTRMGTDKALLTHKGLTLLQHARALLHTLDISETIILGRPNEPDGRKDYAPGEGPAANIAAFINTQKPPFKLVVLPVDMPLIETEQMAHLMSLKQGGFFEDLYLPFYVKITESKNISAVKMKCLLKHLDIAPVPIKETWRENLVNINENKDLPLLTP